MLSSVGSTWTPSKISELIPYPARELAMRAGTPSSLIRGSVRMRTRRAPCWAMSKPISSTAPGPNFSGGAPQVKMLSSARSLPVEVIAGSFRRGADGGRGREASGRDLIRLLQDCPYNRVEGSQIVAARMYQVGWVWLCLGKRPFLSAVGGVVMAFAQRISAQRIARPG